MANGMGAPKHRRHECAVDSNMGRCYGTAYGALHGGRKHCRYAGISTAIGPDITGNMEGKLNATVSRLIDVAGAAILLGLIVRWGPNFAQVINATGNAAATFARQLTLADVQGQG